MTYISRRTRIILSRWLDECDADHRLQVSRRRSDGRLKRYISCDDVRAWVNNNCIKNEYLLDLMSNGEAAGRQPFRLYGRFIPVPVLFELLRNKGREVKDGGKNGQSGGSSQTVSVRIQGQKGGYDNEAVPTTDQQENQFFETRLYECAGLLAKAVCKLEKIDGIVAFADEELENCRNEEIQDAYKGSRLVCTCSKGNDNSANTITVSKTNVKNAKCHKLLRKISGLREKIKKIRACQQCIDKQIRTSQKRVAKCSSSVQVTEIYNSRLQKKMQRLISEKGALVTELCHAVKCLNAQKKSSRSSMSCRQGNSGQGETDEELRCDDAADAMSQCSSNSSDSGKVLESSSCENYLNDNDKGSTTDCLEEALEPTTNFSGKCTKDPDNRIPGKRCSDRSNPCRADSSGTRNAFAQNDQKTGGSASGPGFLGQAANKGQTSADGKSDQEKTESIKKKKLTFVCPESSCKSEYKESLSDFENSLTPKQQAIILDAIEHLEKGRAKDATAPKSKSSPATDNKVSRQRLNTSPASRSDEAETNLGRSRSATRNSKYMTERRTKSETTMKDIEKKVRNYEVRLGNLDHIDYRVEELKQKLLNATRLREMIEKQKAEERKQRMATQETCEREINRLCTENYELKRQVQVLTNSLEMQCKKIWNLKCTVKRARELECEAEELKKELSACRSSYQYERECNTRWESVVALQRTEIEKLINHIRKLTTMNDRQAYSPCGERKNVQRSRSYSPELIKVKKIASKQRKPEGRQSWSSSWDDEEALCYCDQYRDQDNRRRVQERVIDRNCCQAQSNRRMEWCMN